MQVDDDSWVCCFCSGGPEGRSDAQVEIVIRTSEGNQGLRAHPKCLQDRIAVGIPSLLERDLDGLR